MNRREVVAGAPCLLLTPNLGAVAAAPAVQLLSTASVEDPILPHYREWLDAKNEWWRWYDAPGNGNFDFPESLEAERREDLAFEAMMQTRATTMEGIAALCHVLWTINGPSARADLPEFQDQCEHYEHQPALALWRSATGLEGVPPGFQVF